MRAELRRAELEQHLHSPIEELAIREAEIQAVKVDVLVSDLGAAIVVDDLKPEIMAASPQPFRHIRASHSNGYCPRHERRPCLLQARGEDHWLSSPPAQYGTRNDAIVRRLGLAFDLLPTFAASVLLYDAVVLHLGRLNKEELTRLDGQLETPFRRMQIPGALTTDASCMHAAGHGPPLHASATET